MFKNQLLLILLIFLSLIMTSCSTSLSEYFNKKEETGKRNEELIKSFEGEDEVFKKFKEKVKKVEPSVITKTKKEKIKKTEISKKNKKRVLSVSKKVKKIIIKKSKYPEEYPEEYKKIDIDTEKYWSSFKPIRF